MKNPKLAALLLFVLSASHQIQGAVGNIPGQTNRTATAVATVVNGFLVSVTVTDGGAGYLVPPSVAFTDGSGSGASAVATINTNGAVDKVIVLDAGNLYASSPVVDITAPLPGSSVLDIYTLPGLLLVGTLGSTNEIQFADALGQTNVWFALTNVILESSPYLFVDLTVPPGARRFYRTVGQDLNPVNPDPTNLIWIPPGRFTMGSPTSEVGRFSQEGPPTVVTLTQGFWMGKYKVTQAQYVSLIGTNPSAFTNDLRQPVENLTWVDATNYCDKLTKNALGTGGLPPGYVYRLPTEAEHEYACRAGTTTRFSYGDDPDDSQLSGYAWFDANSGNTTHFVGLKRPNPWGLYDMHGDVMEFCLDWLGGISVGPLTDPRGSVRPNPSAIRGGSYVHTPDYSRSAARFESNGNVSWDLGLRVVLARP